MLIELKVTLGGRKSTLAIYLPACRVHHIDFLDPLDWILSFPLFSLLASLSWREHHRNSYHVVVVITLVLILSSD